MTLIMFVLLIPCYLIGIDFPVNEIHLNVDKREKHWFTTIFWAPWFLIGKVFRIMYEDDTKLC